MFASADGSGGSLWDPHDLTRVLNTTCHGSEDGSPVCERARGTAASRPGGQWWPQPGGPHGGRGCVRERGCHPQHGRPPTASARLACLSDHRPSGHLQSGIVLSSGIRVPSTKDPACLIWLRASGRGGGQGRLSRVLVAPTASVGRGLAVALWGPDTLVGPQQRLLPVGGCGFPGLSWDLALACLLGTVTPCPHSASRVIPGSLTQ